MKILVVDDEPDVASLVKLGIAYQRPDYEIVESHSGADALARAAREQWDLVILDLTMPELDGFTLLGALRGGGSDVPIIVLTARHAEQDRVHGLELGADDYGWTRSCAATTRGPSRRARTSSSAGSCASTSRSGR
jgi:DNA-binding response OmpR family regulator